MILKNERTKAEEIVEENELSLIEGSGRRATSGRHRDPQPWLASDGELKSIEDIKNISKNWSAEIWEEYLKTVEVNPHEDEVPLANGGSIESVSEPGYASVLSDLTDKKSYPSLAAAMKKAFARLTPQEREIIELTCWQNLSSRQVAKHLNLARATVRTVMERGLHKIRRELTTHNHSSKIPTKQDADLSA